jgi:hypothetical protein
MPGNNAPAAYQQQGDVLNAFARDQNAPNADFAALLDEEHLRSLKPIKKDARLSAEAEAKNFRFHARRHMAAALGWRDRQPFPNAVDDALYSRWPSATRTGYVLEHETPTPRILPGHLRVLRPRGCAPAVLRCVARIPLGL